MRKQLVVIATAAIAVAGASLMPALRAAGQSAAAAPKAATAKAATASANIKRLPDGTPDIRGAWNKAGGGLNEANSPIKDTALKPFGVLSEPQGFGQGQVTAGRGGKALDRGARGAGPRYMPDPRPPQGIIDPKDRVLPYTPEGLARRIDYAKNVCCPAKSLWYIELSMRCIPPSPASGGNLYITQRPGEVAFLFENNHQSRIIYTDGRPHPAKNVIFHGGHSVGHWEGNTLVVDTTNLDGRIHYAVGGTIAPFSHDLHFTERFTVVSDKLITTELTYSDPQTFTKPVTTAGFMYPTDPDGEEYVPEFTCHEGSYALLDTFGF